MSLDGLQWTCAALGALLVGISKTAINGLAVLVVALFTYSFASGKQANGLVLPLLIFGDLVAVLSYRSHTQWRYLWKLFPWTALGVILGTLVLGRMSDRGVSMMIGAIILGLAALSYWRRSRRVPADGPTPLHASVAAGVGVLAGMITLVANAAGPLMAIYLISMRLPKMEYLGTASVFFLLLNLFKVPFMASLGLITVDSLKFNLTLLPAVLIGAALGRLLLPRIDQRLFEQLVLALSALAGLLLLV